MQEMMHCFNQSVLERQRAHLQWHQDPNNNLSIENFFSLQSDQGLGDGWPNLTTTPHYPIHPRGEEEEEEEEELVTPTSTTITTTTTISNSTPTLQASKEKTSKKRKADKSTMVSSDDDGKRRKGNHGNNSSKEDNNDKTSDYIHVRARRGQATDSHSLAERVRRERISERMKYLQGLVPGCDKITGKAGMLDEIINYVQSLQRQVEFLSMKLAAVNPRQDFNMETLFSKEMNLPCNSNMSTVGISSELTDPNFLQFNSLQQLSASCGLDMAMNPAELALRRSISAPVSAPQPFLDSCFNVQMCNAGWENELHNLYGVEFHPLQGNILSNLKREM